MSLYIGIDPGTSCGWAVLDQNGNRIASGTWNLQPRKSDGAGMRYVRFEQNFKELLNAYDGLVAYELVAAHKGTDAAHIYGGIVASITRLCEEAGRDYCGVPVGTIKKIATGKGNASKNAMLDPAIERWGWPNERGVEAMTDDEVDALWCAEAARGGAV